MDIQGFLLQKLLILPGILIGLSFHEFFHGYVSDRLGDPTPRAQGRLSLSPFKHIDPFGFLMLIIVGFGWAKPVQIDLRFYKKPRRDEILVSIAGVTMNLILAIVFTGLIKLYEVTGLMDAIGASNVQIASIVYLLLYFTVQINLVLCIFNLIPIPPLDGFHVLVNIFPIRHSKAVYFLERYGFYILIGLLFLPSILRLPSILDYTLIPLLSWSINILFSIFGISTVGLM